MRKGATPIVATDDAVTVQKIRRAAARCAQCGRKIATVPFNITNVIMCRDCYGAEHYKGKGRSIYDGHSDIGFGDVAIGDL